MRFLPVVHTKTPENADEIGGFRKRFQKWSLLKTVLKIAFYTVISLNVRRKRIKKYALSNEDDLVWKSERETKTLVW